MVMKKTSRIPPLQFLDEKQTIQVIKFMWPCYQPEVSYMMIIMLHVTIDIITSGGYNIYDVTLQLVDTKRMLIPV